MSPLHTFLFSDVLSRMLVLTPKFLMLDLQMSLKRSFGRHLDLDPLEGSPKRICLGMHLLFIRCTCPSHRSRLLHKTERSDRIPVLLRTSLFGILSCPLMFGILRKQQRSKELNLFSCFAYVVQVSAPYRSVHQNLCFGGQFLLLVCPTWLLLFQPVY